MVRETRCERDEFSSRATDADLGDDEESAGTGTAVEATQKAVPAKKPAYLPPTRSKNASYLAAAKNKIKDRLAAEAAAAKSGSVGTKGNTKGKATSRRLTTKKQAAEKTRREKKEKEARALARAEAAASRRVAEKEKERTRIVEEERSGTEACKQALPDIQKARDDTARKRKTPPSAMRRAKGMQRKNSSPHVADTEAADDADDKSTTSASVDVVVRCSPPEGRRKACSDSMLYIQHVLTPLMLYDMDVSIVLLSLLLHRVQVTTGPVQARAVRFEFVETTVVLDADDDGSCIVEPPANGMNSDLDGDGADYEDWFVETEGVVQPLEYCGGPDDESDVSSGDDNGLDCEALLHRQKKSEHRKLQRERLNASLANLTGDWETTTRNWDALTPDEMVVLAQDEVVLKKMRVDG
ncbi:unnamed protein product [Phytophthora fragariaefolia]|uniref:Unnamed protein product n=1 Tax=Phytophthora fragariaefolia TaxID=1490495 RepID=A0A9W6X0X1_9STRA|nr:unnamed protein product [Phytophthora fragariaefolia]